MASGSNGSATFSWPATRGGDLLRLGEPLARDEHARERAARLAGVQVALADPVHDRGREVGVVQDHVRGLAAELERDALDGLRGHLADALARRRRARERDHVDVVVRGDRLADDGAEPRHEVEAAGGQAGLLEDLGEDERVQRRDLAGLDDDRAAGGERRRDLRADLVQRVVPRRDAADDADRLAHDERVPHLLLELDVEDEVGHRAERHRRQAGLDHLREPVGHPDLAADQRRDLLAARGERRGDGAKEPGALRDRRRGPGVERGARGGDGAVDVRRRALGHAAHHLLGRRVDDVDAAAAGRLDPLAADEQTVAVDRLYVMRELGRLVCLDCHGSPPSFRRSPPRCGARAP